jgi:hypothetical protein
MKPTIDSTEFGSIRIENQLYQHDVYIDLDGRVSKRKKKLSKAVHGTSHMIAADELKHIYQKGVQLLVIGTGQYAQVSLSDEAREFIRQKGCQVLLDSTPRAIEAWNKSSVQRKLGLFHVTC